MDMIIDDDRLYPLHISVSAGAILLTDRYLDKVSELACLDNPESYAGESLVLLVGPPKPDRSKDRGQTRYDPPPPPTCRFSIGLTTLSCKNDIVTETATNNLYNSRKIWLP